MNRSLIIRPGAEADITDAAVWYDSREPGLGLELISEVQTAISRALRVLTPLGVFVEIQKFAVFSLVVFLIASSSLFDQMQ
jgi:hypothetical protein